jgi:hypothetical protein
MDTGRFKTQSGGAEPNSAEHSKRMGNQVRSKLLLNIWVILPFGRPLAWASDQIPAKLRSNATRA